MTTARDLEQVGDQSAGPHPMCSRAACATAAAEASVPQMRRFVLYCVRHLGLSENTCDTACLVVSELVTNAVLHSGSHSVAVLVAIGPEHLLISVRDCGCWRERPEARRSGADADAPCGRGLELVRALTDRCTVASGPTGTLVEACVRLPAARSAHPEEER
ncbi:ATP-binding protein [Streptomyces sp. NRRL B-24484]|uniref:ATP-binding protein n=1 Tax=Streptomyces sp. NRRL B-24484 TaxID=1463833 RepID=UPI00069342F9|nr:ATP-binding protein [Streptomyces sp. NRRL B-24484]